VNAANAPMRLVSFTGSYLREAMRATTRERAAEDLRSAAEYVGWQRVLVIELDDGDFVAVDPESDRVLLAARAVMPVEMFDADVDDPEVDR